MRVRVLITMMIVGIASLIFLVQAPLGQADVKPGDKIDSTNWQKVEKLVPQSVLPEIKAGRFSFTMREYDCLSLAPILREVSEKYAGTVRLGPNGELLNHVAGIPFPDVKPSDPQAGIKMAWNFSYTSTLLGMDDMAITAAGDTKKDATYTRYCIDKSGNTIDQETSYYQIRWTGRYAIPPMPAVPGYGHLERSFLLVTRSPRDAAGKTLLYQVALDPQTPDDMWIYLPSIRRIRRFPTTQRYATQAPTDYNWDDTFGFNGRTTAFTYRYVGERELIWPLYKGHFGAKYKKGYWLPENETFVKTRVYVIEQISKDPNYSYSKRVWYVHPESWALVLTSIYDRKGQLWKELYVAHTDAHNLAPAGRTLVIIAGGNCIDLQSQHKTVSNFAGSSGAAVNAMNIGMQPKTFALPTLNLISRGEAVRY